MKIKSSPCVMAFNYSRLSTWMASLIFLTTIHFSSAQTDISSLVNPSTGDFSYSIPVLEVPGPEGSFPIVLNYAAGVRLEQEASWVGLGWDLSVGAISRSVERFPDDYSGGEVRIQQTHPGGTKTFKGPTLLETLAILELPIIGKLIYNVKHGINKNNQGESSQSGIWDWSIYQQDEENKFLGMTISKDVKVTWYLDKDQVEKGYGFLYQSNLMETTGVPGQRRYSLPKYLTGTTGRSEDAFNQASDYYQEIDTVQGAKFHDNLNPIYWATDKYYVSGPGIGGVMMPYRLDNASIASSYNSNKYYDDQIAVNKIQVVPERDERIQFMFMGEPSNHYDHLKTGSSTYDLNYTSSIDGVTSTIVPSTTQAAELGSVEANRLGLTGGRLRKSRHVQWYTNEEIRKGTAQADGFLNHEPNANREEDAFGEQTNDFPSKGIGGFKVVDENGTTYHFSLPVYTLSRRITLIYEQYTSYETYQEPFAEKWLLTAITGPDFKDSGNVRGQVDLADQGYFVRFDYGKYTDGRTRILPEEGYYSDDANNPDALTKVESVSQDYYLEKISTRSHTLLCVKNDGDELTLKQMVLLKNKDVPSIDAAIQSAENQQGNTSPYHYHDNVLTVRDLTKTVRELLTSKGIRFADLKYIPVKFTIRGGGGEPALSALRTTGKNEQTKTPFYAFDYYQFHDGGFDEDHFYEYEKDHYNAWGFYNDYSGTAEISREVINPGDARAYSLWQVTTPQGERMQITYEPDDYSSISGHAVATDRQAGSIRTKSIKVTDLYDGTFYEDRYEYLLSDGRSSGVVTKEPEVGRYDEMPPFENHYNYPAEAVYYANVRRMSYVNDHQLGGVEYAFITPNSNDVTVNTLFETSTSDPVNVATPTMIFQRKGYETIYRTGLIGSPVSMRTFDALGEYTSETTYEYEDSEYGVLTQGLHLLDETYRNYDETPNEEARNVRNKNARFINSIITYQPYRLAKTTERNLLLNKEQVTYYRGYDFDTGQPRKVITRSDARFYLQETTPAWKITNYQTGSAQGVDFATSGGTNQLNTSAYEAVYQIQPLSEPFEEAEIIKTGVISATAQKLIRDEGIWRSAERYALNDKQLGPDGLASLLTEAEAFDWEGSSQHEKWELVQHPPVAYNDFSRVLESKSLHGVHATQCYTSDDMQVLVTAQNARYKEVAFSGAESSFSGNGFNTGRIDHNSGTLSTARAHTGASSLRVGTGLVGFEYETTIDEQLQNRVMEVAFWFHRSNPYVRVRIRVGAEYSEEEPAVQDLVTVGEWCLYKKQIPVHVSDLSGSPKLNISVVARSNSVFMDDFRVAPLSSDVQCFVYDEVGNLTYTLNNNHFFTQTILDQDYQVIEVKRESERGVHTVEKNDYNFSESYRNEFFDN